MNVNVSFTNKIIAFFLILSFQNFATAQCPPSTTSAANSTAVNVDSGVYSGGANPIVVFQTCTPVVNAAAASIDVEYLGATTTFTKTSTIGVTGNPANCVVKYDNAAADPTITTPFVINFSDNASEDCFYAENGVLPVELLIIQCF